MFHVCCSLHSGYLISKPVNPQCINRKTLSIFHLHIYTTSERQHDCSWTEVGSLGLNPLDESIHFGDKKPQLKRSHPVERRGKDVSLHVHQHLVPPHMLPMTTSTTTSLLTHSCQLQNLTRQRRCLCQIWAVWRSCENASSSPNKCQLALSDITVFAGAKKSASDSFSIQKVVLQFVWELSVNHHFSGIFGGFWSSSRSTTGTAAQPAKWLKMFLPMSPRPAMAMVKAMTLSGVLPAFPSRPIKWIQNQITKAKTVLSNAMFQYVLVAYPVWYLSNTPTHQIHAPSVDIPLAKTEQAFFLQR